MNGSRIVTCETLKGGFSEIYTAHWIDEQYEEWDSKERKLKKFGTQCVVLEELKNVGCTNQRWFE